MSSSLLWSIGGFFLVLTPIIIVHELGHFWAARLSNIRVDEFGLGFPPRAATLGERNGTIFSLNWIPLGGFVRPAGEDDPNVEGGLAAASKRARFFVLIAGASANFVMAFLVFWVAFMLGTPAVEITEVDPTAPAGLAGLMTGDIFLEVNGTRVENSNILAGIVAENAGQEVNLLMRRGAEELKFVMVPRVPGDFNPEIEGPLGVGLTVSATESLGRKPLEAAGDSARSVWNIISLTVRVPAMLISGEITPTQARPVSVVGISQIAGQAAEVSVINNNLFPILNMIGFISVALGFTNLLPIPALDGGRILFVIIEAIRGRRIEPEREGMVHIVGMMVLLSLMVLLIFQDIVNPIF